MRVRAYRNLKHKEFTLSLVDASTGLVCDHVSSVLLRDPAFKSATASQQVACKTRRLVCQWVTGEQIDYHTPGVIGPWRAVLSDPKKVDGFRLADTNERIKSAQWCRIDNTGCWVIL